jgi:hypothetical protein
MSKASEYAARCAPLGSPILDRPEYESQRGWPKAYVDRYGDLRCENWMTPGEALGLAAWIQDTFGEPGGICEKTGGAHRLHTRRDTTGTGTYSTCLECEKAVRV